jgi:predicted AlkP superfamily pyrophosphatase or phosphodiesterase
MKGSVYGGLAVIFLLGFPGIVTGQAQQPAQFRQPKLVLMIVIDQLRGDMPWRYRDRLGPSGFRYLMENGTVFTNAHYCHATTSTAPGHATLSTGGNPPQHGIAGNDWYDAATRQSVNNTQDSRYPIIGTPPGTMEGRSPHKLKSSTFGDELVLSSAGSSRVFSVSIKDRSAVLLAGRLGKAWWYSKTSGQFVTSTFYSEIYPDWVQKWNSSGHADQYRTASWDLLLAPDTYVFKNLDDRLFEKDMNGLGRTFPHSLQDSDQENFYSTLRYTPMGDQLTLSFVKALVLAEKVGQKGTTDVLAVSFSASDYIGHKFGPNSLEAEDNLLRVDRTLQELLAFVDQQLGLKNILIVLTSDHGVSPAPEHMAALGFDAGWLDETRFKQQANLALQKIFNTDRNLVLEILTPNLYLDLDAIESLGNDVGRVERELAAVIMATPGFSLALAKSDIMTGRIPDTPQARQVACGFESERSGNIFVVPDPFWYLSPPPHGDATTHGSPYNYDNHVPIMIAGPGIGAGTVDSPVAPHDVASTISNYLGVAPPSGSIGTPLPVIKN